MNATHKVIVGLATVLSFSVASGVAWSQDAQGDLKVNNKSKVETQHKAKSATGAEMKMEGQAGGGMKAEGGSTKMKGEAGSQTKADSNSQIKGEGQNADTSAGAQSDRKGQMKAEESGSSMKKKHEGSRAEMKSETGKSNRAASGSDHTMKGKSDERMKTGEAKSAGTSNEKTGSVQKNGGVNVNVTTEQKTEIRQVIKTESVRPVEHVTFDVDVGRAIPHSIHLHRLPPRIVKIVPDYESYEYFVLADGRIVIVDPDSYEIVYILT
jgi:hypothetical protein